MKPAHCKLIARLEDGSIYDKHALIIWINDKTGAVTVKTADGYHKFGVEQVLRIEWLPQARLVQRWSELGSMKLWGFDTREGFASFGHTEQDRELASKCIDQYNSGEIRNWVFLPIEKHPLVGAPMPELTKDERRAR